MRLWASHVLAQGAGALDVVGDMWKLSWVYPALPSLVPAGRERRHRDTETCIRTNKHGNLPCCVRTLTLHLKMYGHSFFLTSTRSCICKDGQLCWQKLASKVPRFFFFQNRALLMWPRNPRPSSFLPSIISAPPRRNQAFHKVGPRAVFFPRRWPSCLLFSRVLLIGCFWAEFHGWYLFHMWHRQHLSVRRSVWVITANEPQKSFRLLCIHVVCLWYRGHCCQPFLFKGYRKILWDLSFEEE